MQHPARWIPAALAAFTWTLAPLCGDEWPRFRGPNGQGVAAPYDFPDTWKEEDYAWTAPLPGIGHSSPIIRSGRVFITSADPQTARQSILCFDLETGRKRWQRSFESKPHHLHRRASYASSTPAADAERIYVTWASPDALILKALDHDGRDVWTRNLGPYVSQHGFASSPIVFENLVIFSNSQQEVQLPPGRKPGKSTLMALDAKTGKTVWTCPRKSVRACYTIPCIYETGGQPQLVCYNTGDGYYGVDPYTGKVLWTLPGVFRMRTVSSPVIVGKTFFGSTGSGGGGNYVVAMEPGAPPKERYRITRQMPYVPTPVASGRLVFFVSDRGIATCVDADDGRVQWTKRLRASFSASPIRVGKKIYCVADSGEVICLAADARFRERGRTKLGEPSRATPAVADGMMVLRSYSRLYALPARKSTGKSSSKP